MKILQDFVLLAVAILPVGALQCYSCHGTSISEVTSSCWETVNPENDRFVSMTECGGSCSITVLNHTTIGLRDFTRTCENDCKDSCVHTYFGTTLCKYCCNTDRCNDVLPEHKVTSYVNGNTASTDNLRNWLTKHFSKPRHHAADPSHKLYTRHELTKLLNEFGYQVEKQEFEVSDVFAEDRAPFNYRSFIRTTLRGFNIIAVAPGSQYGTSYDKITVVLAHYDTDVSGNIGFNDNGSGSSALLEVARLFLLEKCSRNFTAVFVLTDFNEEGIFRSQSSCLTSVSYVNNVGASHFLCDWLVPHLQATSGVLKLAINLDSVLNLGTRITTAPLSKEKQKAIIRHSRNGGNFLKNFKKRRYSSNWWLITSSSNVREEIGETGTTSPLFDANNFLTLTFETNDSTSPKRSYGKFIEMNDCQPFYEYEQQDFPCISVSDTGDQRRSTAVCSNDDCVISGGVNSENIEFLAQLVTEVRHAVSRLSDKTCENETTSKMSSDSSNSKISKRCSDPLMKKQSENNIFVSATCGRIGKIFEMCPTLTDGLWGKLDGNTAWIPKQARAGKVPLWFQVDLGKRMNVSSIATQGVRRMGYVRSYMISYSNNEKQWEWYIPTRNQWPSSERRVEIHGNSNARATVKQKMKPNIVARFIRIYPRWWRRRIALRIQIYGCDLST